MLLSNEVIDQNRRIRHLAEPESGYLTISHFLETRRKLGLPLIPKWLVRPLLRDSGASLLPSNGPASDNRMGLTFVPVSKMAHNNKNYISLR